jgi:hypothetical protein
MVDYYMLYSYFVTQLEMVNGKAFNVNKTHIYT